MTVLVTGAAGFIGRHMMEALGRACIPALPFTEDHSPQELAGLVAQADAVIHLAGVNRPQDPQDFDRGNRGLTETLVEEILKQNRPLGVIFSSSTQADLDNPYGQSKLAAEKALEALASRPEHPIVVFRLTNVFGKWARPNYNSAVATFCYNIAHGLPIQVNDPDRVMKLVYVDDVVEAFLGALGDLPDLTGLHAREAGPIHEATLQRIADLIYEFRDVRTSLVLPSFADPFMKKLYAAYTSYLEGENREYGLTIRSDPRGSLAEFLKSPHFGQIFVSRTKPGITRGNHYHHSKGEKFLVLEGEAIIRFRPITGGPVEEHRVQGEDYRVVDITPGWTHSIENVGTGDLITLFWTNEVFNPERPDTMYLEV
jgi:UDP-2-acetamido-2,6-beta-L-arabino-hexul-4-ose reductase